jgi:D-3-phosphoglycerate dehydrogenase
MTDARRLALLPRRRVINVAAARWSSMRSASPRRGHLWGAGVDVTEVEPLATDSPLWTARNVIITPHVGGQRASRIDDMTDLFCENIRRYRAGERLINLVDKQLGFPERGAILYEA